MRRMKSLALRRWPPAANCAKPRRRSLRNGGWPEARQCRISTPSSAFFRKARDRQRLAWAGLVLSGFGLGAGLHPDLAALDAGHQHCRAAAFGRSGAPPSLREARLPLAFSRYQQESHPSLVRHENLRKPHESPTFQSAASGVARATSRAAPASSLPLDCIGDNAYREKLWGSRVGGRVSCASRRMRNTGCAPASLAALAGPGRGPVCRSRRGSRLPYLDDAQTEHRQASPSRCQLMAASVGAQGRATAFPQVKFTPTPGAQARLPRRCRAFSLRATRGRSTTLLN